MYNRLSFFCIWSLSLMVLGSTTQGSDSTGTGTTVPDMSWGDTLQSTHVRKVLAMPKDSIAIFDISGKRTTKNAKGVVIKNNKVTIKK